MRPDFRTEGRRTPPATGRRPGSVGMPPRWQTSIGIRGGFSETARSACAHTISWGELKQPDKQKLINRVPAVFVFRRHALVGWRFCNDLPPEKSVDVFLAAIRHHARRDKDFRRTIQIEIEAT